MEVDSEISATPRSIASSQNTEQEIETNEVNGYSENHMDDDETPITLSGERYCFHVFLYIV